LIVTVSLPLTCGAVSSTFAIMTFDELWWWWCSRCSAELVQGIDGYRKWKDFGLQMGI